MGVMRTTPQAQYKNYAGAWALSPPAPMRQGIKSFCAAFFKKLLLAYSNAAQNFWMRWQASVRASVLVA